VSLASLFASASVVGVSGSRSASGSALALARAAVGRVLALAPGARVVVGCTDGVDAAVREVAPASRLGVFRAASFGGGRGAFAARSVACVHAVAAAGAGGVWLSFPGGPCPAGLVPSPSASACFAGFGSGSWASLALAIGLGVRSVVFLPAGVPAPAGWPLAPVADAVGWFLFAPSAPASQPSLFAR
jgi:hypothetical protein